MPCRLIVWMTVKMISGGRRISTTDNVDDGVESPAAAGCYGHGVRSELRSNGVP